MEFTPSLNLRDLVQAAVKYRSATHSEPECILMHPDTHNETYFGLPALLGIPIIVSPNCPKDKIYLMTDAQQRELARSIQTLLEGRLQAQE